MARILVTEAIADNGLELLRKAGHQVEIRHGLTPDDLLKTVKGANALIVRSATKVTSAVLAAAPDLVVVGRAGIGLDNIDVPAATRQGVLVVNAPQSNVVSAAEQAMALLLACARNVPQAHASLKGGAWERSRWEGVELYGKTMGILGLGRVGALVAQRCAALGMRLIAFDPYITAERAKGMDVELTSLEDCVRRSDFLSIHLPLTAETTKLIDAEVLALAKPNLRLVNTSRGGVIDEAALYDALSSGQIAGAGLDVFADEPCTDSPLFQLDNVVVTPHLGASTREAQDKASDTIAEMVQLALAGEFVPFAVNIDAAEASATIRPFLPLAERLGRLMAGLCRGAPATLEIAFAGQIAEYDTRILQLSVLRGLLSAVTPEPVTFVNAPILAAGVGMTVSDWKTATSDDYRNKITLRSSCGHSLAGTLAGLRMETRIVMVDDHDVEVPPSRHLLVVRNDDRPGMIGAVGTTMGNYGVNISNMAVGRTKGGGSALMVLDTDSAVPQPVIDELRLLPGITGVDPIDEV
ncbi:MAG: phosphoglycerate dehydrogenase [Ilumatobacteraceae bacterium]